jgi:hypothetical protein
MMRSGEGTMVIPMMLLTLLWLSELPAFEPNMSSAHPPAALLGILTSVGFSKSEIEQYKEGKFLSGTLESTNERELAAKFGCIVHAPASKLANVFLTGRREFDESALQIGTMDDLADLKLEPNRDAIVKTYLKAASGGSELNLSDDEARQFSHLKTAQQVEEVLRTILESRYKQYLELGLHGISPYSRGKGKSFEPGAELLLKSQKAELLKKYAPNFYDCIGNYPSVKPEGLQEEFTWVNFTIDEKPNICLVHKFGMMEGDNYAFCQRHYYVSRGHNSVQGVGGAFPLGNEECAVVYGSRTSTDQVAGFGGSAKRAIGAKMMTGKIAKNLQAARDGYFEESK